MITTLRSSEAAELKVLHKAHTVRCFFCDWGSQHQITEVFCWQTCGKAGCDSRSIECHHPRPLPTASQLRHSLI